MKIFIILLAMAAAIVVVTNQQQLHRASKPRGLIWLTPYSPSRKPVLANYQPIYDNQHHQEEINEIPSKLTPHSFRRKNRPPIPFPYLPLNEDVSFTEDNNNSANDIEDDEEDEYPDTQSRIKWFKRYGGFHNKGFNNYYDGRFLYSSTINNPFYKTATFTITSTVTTLGSLVICVPSNNLVAVPSPTCAGRKKRQIEDSAEDNQFPIAPSETLKLIPTALPSVDAIQQTRESRVMLANKKKFHKLHSSKEDVIPSRVFDEIPSESTEDDQQSQHPMMMREERLLGGGYAASTTVTSYSFVGATLTSTVLLDPTGMNVAVCLPAGYVVC